MAGRVFRGLPRQFRNALGEPVEWLATGQQEPVSLRGIFTREYYRALPDGSVAVENASPAVSFPSADVPDVRQSDLISAQDDWFQVVERQPDGMGMTHLILHEHDGPPEPEPEP
jgi:hypothetical protein